MERGYIDKIIREISKELKSKYDDFRGIYLFGSQARNDGHKDSDIDIAIIFDREIKSSFRDEIGSIIYNYDLKYDIFFDDMIYNQKDIFSPKTPIRENIKNEGIFYGI